MKIAIIANHNTPVIKKEGTLNNLIFYLIQFLMSNNHTVTLFALEGSLVPCNFIALDKNKLVSNPFQEEWDKQEVVQNVNYARTMQIIQKTSYDLVHNFSQHYLPMVLGNELKAPFVNTLTASKTRELEFCMGLENWNNTVFVCTSESLKSWYKEYLLDMRVIYNGIHMDTDSVAANKAKNIIAWDGNINPKSKLVSLIKIAEKKQYKIVLMGPLTDRAYYEEHIVPYIKQGVVKYIGDISDDMKGDLFKNCKVYVNASTEELHNYYTILKALSFGTLVVTWDSGVMKEIITKDSGVLCAKDNYDKLIEGVDLSMSLPSTGSLKTMSKFTQQATIESYLGLYQELLKETN